MLHNGEYISRKPETAKGLNLRDTKTDEMHYYDKYVWGIVNTVQKLVYYLYE